jgi:hypothetical protein
MPSPFTRATNVSPASFVGNPSGLAWLVSTLADSVVGCTSTGAAALEDSALLAQAVTVNSSNMMRNNL